MTEAYSTSPNPISRGDSFLFRVGAWLCLLAVITNALLIWPAIHLVADSDLAPGPVFYYLAASLRLAVWQIIYCVALVRAAWNFDRTNLNWRITILLAVMLVVDFTFWLPLGSFHFPILIIFGVPKAVFLALLVALACREWAFDHQRT